MTASPNPCVNSSGVCTTKITWNSNTPVGVQIFVSTDGQAPRLLGCGMTGTFSQDLPWIAAGHTYDFTAYESTVCAPTPVALKPVASTQVLGFKAATQYKNAASYGVKCNGVTDDRAAFNKATAAMKDFPNKTLIIPPSNQPCMLSGPFSLVSNMKLWAAPGTAVLKPLGSNISDPLLMNATNVSNTKIYGVTFDGGGADFPNRSPIMTLYQCSNVDFERVTWQNTSGMGFNGSRLNYSGVRNSRAVNVGNYWKTNRQVKDRWQALSFCCGEPNTWGLYNYVLDNYFEDIGLDGVSTGYATGFTVSGNEFRMQNHQNKTLAADDYPGAIYYVQSTGGMITNNIIDGTAGNGIDTQGLQYSVISGNTITNAGVSGIGLFLGTDGTTNVDTVTLSNNRIYDCNRLPSFPWSRAGITIGGGGFPKNVKLLGNISRNNNLTTQRYGLEVSNWNGYITRPTDLWIDRNNDFHNNTLGELSNASYSN